jgi:conserved oligomeric Golgi complex subunit 2
VYDEITAIACITSAHARSLALQTMASHLGATSPLSPSSRYRLGSSYSYSGFTLPSSPSDRSSSPPPGFSADGGIAELPLPFPTALSRADFLSTDFDAVAYLSHLHDSTINGGARHQTLEDLRQELRERSSAISAELLELVNTNYVSFLGLGDELKGGEERVEDVRVGLLGFRRAVGEIKAQAAARKREVEGLCSELGGVRDCIEMGRKMLELEEQIAGLEEKLLVGSLADGKRPAAEDDWDELSEEEDLEDDEDSHSFVASSPAKLATLARAYWLVEQLADTLGRSLPFVRKVEARMTKCRNTILLDLGTALEEARRAGSRGQMRTLRYLAIYRLLRAEMEAVRILKER